MKKKRRQSNKYILANRFPSTHQMRRFYSVRFSNLYVYANATPLYLNSFICDKSSLTINSHGNMENVLFACEERSQNFNRFNQLCVFNIEKKKEKKDTKCK